MSKNLRSYKRIKGDRYDHWLWNGFLMNWLSHQLVDLSSWLRNKQFR